MWVVPTLSMRVIRPTPPAPMNAMLISRGLCRAVGLNAIVSMLDQLFVVVDMLKIIQLATARTRFDGSVESRTIMKLAR